MAFRLEGLALSKPPFSAVTDGIIQAVICLNRTRDTSQAELVNGPLAILPPLKSQPMRAQDHGWFKGNGEGGIGAA